MSISQLETNRKQTVVKIAVFLALPILISILVALIVMQTKYRLLSYSIIMMGIVISGILWFLCIKNIKQKFTNTYKETIVKQQLEKVFTNVQYVPEQGISKSRIQQTNMINMPNYFSSSDYLSARYQNVQFEQSDVTLKDKRQYLNNKGETRTQIKTFFSGRYIIFDFNKTFSTNFMIVSAKFQISNRGSIFGNKMKQIEMEDAKFNRLFHTYGYDEHDVFYVLTPPMMEKMKQIIEIKQKPIIFCFYNNQLHIAIDKEKNAFEHKLLKPINEKEEIETIQQDISVITQIADMLNLSKSLFKKT